MIALHFAVNNGAFASFGVGIIGANAVTALVVMTVMVMVIVIVMVMAMVMVIAMVMVMVMVMVMMRVMMLHHDTHVGCHHRRI